MEEEFEHLFKLVVIGDSCVGKSKLIWRYINDEFHTSSHTTIGVELATKVLELDGRRVKVQVWDTAGQEKYRALTSNYYRGAVGVMFVYDISKSSTFANLDNWLNEVMKYHQEGVSFILVANKTDVAQREVSTEQGQEFAQKHSLEYIETSALDRTNVERAFTLLIRKALQAQGSVVSTTRRMSELKPMASRKAKKCC
jgi:small GTP-binding protein